MKARWRGSRGCRILPGMAAAQDQQKQQAEADKTEGLQGTHALFSLSMLNTSRLMITGVSIEDAG